jgi:hypothetical protein
MESSNLLAILRHVLFIHIELEEVWSQRRFNLFVQYRFNISFLQPRVRQYFPDSMQRTQTLTRILFKEVSNDPLDLMREISCFGESNFLMTNRLENFVLVMRVKRWKPNNQFV